MRTVWTVVGVVLAVVIAWVLVDVALRVLAFGFRLALVAGVAVVVFLVLRMLTRRRPE
ncbi:hypothetical protein [Agrococcus sp. SGAir0287]|uniref:hypothetical protein n=1 Tax=Agrococcus sp. SGAir0287 TaxID=2070347 RepID=UPI0015865F35|nr:hypothetical protein [Agrococcus sp. SGAir0287]